MNRLKSLWKSLTPAPEVTGQGAAETMKNFTPRAQQALALAHKEADRFHHNFVGTEHVLLGIISLGQGVAVNVLLKMGLNLETVRAEVEKQVGTGPDQKIIGHIPYTPRVKKVLALAAKEAKALNHTYVGTEHILLGLLQEGDGVAARVLQEFKIDIEQTRQEILKELDPNYSATHLPALPPGIKPLAGQVSQKAQSDAVDTSKQYDVYCAEGEQHVVVYRNVLFKGAKNLLHESRKNLFSQFVEIEQADGRTLFIAMYSIIKFCEPGTTPNSETVPGITP
jgi:ATP-dependent Clp protease ATP-binding subunit ClpA